MLRKRNDSFWAQELCRTYPLNKSFTDIFISKSIKRTKFVCTAHTAHLYRLMKFKLYKVQSVQCTTFSFHFNRLSQRLNSKTLFTNGRNHQAVGKKKSSWQISSLSLHFSLQILSHLIYIHLLRFYCEVYNSMRSEMHISGIL